MACTQIVGGLLLVGYTQSMDYCNSDIASLKYSIVVIGKIAYPQCLYICFYGNIMYIN